MRRVNLAAGLTEKNTLFWLLHRWEPWLLHWWESFVLADVMTGNYQYFGCCTDWEYLFLAAELIWRFLCTDYVVRRYLYFDCCSGLISLAAFRNHCNSRLGVYEYARKLDCFWELNNLIGSTLSLELGHFCRSEVFPWCFSLINLRVE